MPTKTLFATRISLSHRLVEVGHLTPLGRKLINTKDLARRFRSHMPFAPQVGVAGLLGERQIIEAIGTPVFLFVANAETPVYKRIIINVESSTKRSSAARPNWP